MSGKGAVRHAIAPRVGRPGALQQFERVIFDSVEAHLRMDTPGGCSFPEASNSSISCTSARQVPTALFAHDSGYSGNESIDESGEALRLADRLHRVRPRGDVTRTFLGLGPPDRRRH